MGRRDQGITQHWWTGKNVASAEEISDRHQELTIQIKNMYIMKKSKQLLMFNFSSAAGARLVS